MRPAPDRLPAVDGLRGLLALVVLAKHAGEQAAWRPPLLHEMSQAAVLIFFVLSGYVLTRNYAGSFALFLIRRFVRLWPVYALCLIFGFAINSIAPQLSLFFWLPVYVLDGRPPVNLPAWSLHIEAWAMLGLPLLASAAGAGVRGIAGALAALTVAVLLQSLFVFGYFFFAGALLARWRLRNRFLESRGLQWLGKLSYSLYLTHWLVLVFAHRCFGPVGAMAAIPLTFAVAWLVWRTVELPSLRASRWIETVFARAPRWALRAA